MPTMDNSTVEAAPELVASAAPAPAPPSLTPALDVMQAIAASQAKMIGQQAMLLKHQAEVIAGYGKLWEEGGKLGKPDPRQHTLTLSVDTRELSGRIAVMAVQQGLAITRIRALEEALRHAAEVFKGYAVYHRAKGEHAAIVKAEANEKEELAIVEVLEHKWQDEQP